MELIHKNAVKSYAMLRFKRMQEFYVNKMLQNKLRTIVRRKKGQITNTINVDKEWLKHPLMEHIRYELEGILEEQIKKQKILCDKKDALLQTLFRITTFSPKELFKEGEDAMKILTVHNTTDKWENICKLDEKIFNKFEIRKELVLEIINEQLLIINERILKSKLPIEKIVSEQNVFDGTWKLEWNCGKIVAVKKDDLGNSVEKVNVRFGKVKPEIATAFHKDLHYIHTPRTKEAWGLYLEGEKLPFSVEAIEPVDRNYKRTAILLQGYNPNYCIELTRLYNWPGSPMNTTSVMDGLVFALYKQNYPQIQAATTAIMPTYSFSKSQIAGGMKKIYLIKKAHHIFVKRNLNGRIVFEHITNRRLKEYPGAEIIKNHPEFPLLPVVEFIQPLRENELDKFNGKMLCKGW